MNTKAEQTEKITANTVLPMANSTAGTTVVMEKKSVKDTKPSKINKDKPAKETVTAILLERIQPFADHPFLVEADAAMAELKESVALNGVLEPVLLRPKGDGFEMISGHRRMAVAKELGLETIPSIVREMDDDQATLAMVDANRQRENILPSEKAFAYKMRDEALKRIAAGHGVPPNGRTTEQIGKENGMSDRNVRRYIRLTRLLPELLKLVDSNKLGASIAETLSFLSQPEQETVLSFMQSELRAPSKEQAQRLKQLHEDGEFTEEAARVIFQSGKNKTSEKITIPLEALERFFTADATPAQITEAIIAALEQWERIKALFPKATSPDRMIELIAKALQNEKKRQRDKQRER
jgi:ParB family chromosome partitioning protein